MVLVVAAMVLVDVVVPKHLLLMVLSIQEVAEAAGIILKMAQQELAAARALSSFGTLCPK